MKLTEYRELEQGTPEWLDVRRGVLTASVIGQLIALQPRSATLYDCTDCGSLAGDPCTSKARKAGDTPAPIKTLHPARTSAAAIDGRTDLVVANNDTSRGLTAVLAAERITKHTEDVYVSYAMQRGTDEEPIARALYAEHRGVTVDELGFMVRAETAWTIGFSPDGLVGDDGLIEIKSRAPKKHLTTILADRVPDENMAQIQSGLLVTGRAWCDYISYCGGMRPWIKRVEADPDWFAALAKAAAQFELRADIIQAIYETATLGLPETERLPDHNDLGLEF